MPKYVIERSMPDLDKLSAAQLRQAAADSAGMIRELGSAIHWINSYITADKMYCVFVAPNEEVILEHARCLGLPADKVAKVVAIADPAAAE